MKYIFSPALLDQSASLVGIAVAHSAFNILCTALLLPMSGVLEAVAKKIIPDAKTSEKDVELDERLLDTPPLALESCRRVTAEMGELSVSARKESIKTLTLYTDKLAEDIREKEEKTVAVRMREKGDIGSMKLDEFVARVKKENDEKTVF